ncbi:structural constituent of ribosome, partial [Gamsiella multidivaricata]
MSGLPTILKATEEDIKLLLSAQSHLGTKNCDVHMEPYVWKRRADGKDPISALRVRDSQEDDILTGNLGN